MTDAFFFLLSQSLRNRLFARFTRLRQPKYLVTAIVGGLFFGFYILAVGARVFLGPGAHAAFDSDNANLIGSAVLMLFMAIAVFNGLIMRNQNTGLTFSEAEIAFLFPAPISRRGLINYRLLSSQTPVLISAVFLTLLSGRWHFGFSHAIFAFFGWWIIMTVLNLHGTASVLARKMLLDRGVARWWQQLAFVVAIVGVAYVFFHGAMRLPRTPAYMADDMSGFLSWIQGALTTDWMPYLLYPFRLVVQPYNAPNALSFALYLPAALAIIALYYIAIINMDVAFEEASIVASQKRATRVAAIRTRQATGAVVAKKARRAPFRLAPIGPPFLAIVWKNLINAGNFFNPITFIRLAVIVAVISLMDSHGLDDSSMPKAALLASLVLLYSFFYGPSLLRMDFRSDLPMMDQLILYPVPSWQIVLGEILAPVLVLAAFQWLVILFAALTFNPPDNPVPTSLRVSITLSAALLAPMIDLVMFITPNAIALIMPSWVSFDKNAPRAFENIGQNLILSVGRLFVVLLALLPASLLGWLVYLGVNLLAGNAAAILAAGLTTAVVLAVESAAAIYFLSSAFSSFDLSAELAN